MKEFKDIDMMPHPLHPEGVCGRVFFKNGYGISVVRHSYTYGGTKGLYEAAILNKDGRITYKTPITNDVIGWLTESEVTELMHQIQSLKRWKVVLNNFLKTILKNKLWQRQH